MLDGLTEYASDGEVVGDLGEQLLYVHFAIVGGCLRELQCQKSSTGGRHGDDLPADLLDGRAAYSAKPAV